MVIVLKTPDDLAAMRVAGRAVWRAVSSAVEACNAGMTTAEIAGAARAASPGMREAAVFVCVNDEAAFAPPGARRLEPGDLVTVDVAGAVAGWWADAAVVAVVPPASEAASRLMRAAEGIIGAGLASIVPGVAWSVVAAAMRAEAGRWGVGLAASLCGHGVGRRPHEGPELRPGEVGGGRGDVALGPGMVVSLEPTVTAGLSGEIVERGGVAVTADGGLVCTQERTVAILEESVLILTGA
ncbi:MAG: methionyl aminopeptidase [Phycisphaeraceae bacterium]|nr:methionyl aminopeptidase [Phycisphaeraceae bacterium]